jgi:hypothetical protein
VKITNIFKKTEKSISADSFRQALTANVTVDNGGNIIGTDFLSSADHLSKNVSVNTIISKQSSIINEAELIVKEKSDEKDKIVKNKEVLAFLDWINFPNSTPSPRSLDDIVNHVYQQYFKKGIVSLVMKFKGEISKEGFLNTSLPISTTYNNNHSKPYYTVQLDNVKTENYFFDPAFLNYVKREGNNISLLFVVGNFDNSTLCYKSPFEDIIQYVKLQNHLINFAENFHQNACFPSQIITLTFKGAKIEETPSSAQIEKFKQAVSEFKQELKNSQGASNAGKIIVPSHPSLEVKVVPLNIPTNAGDNVKYQELVSDKLFSYVDGGSTAAFEGKTEFSNNANQKLQDLYDGTFRYANSIILKPLTIFMRSLVLLQQASGVDSKKIFLTFDISSVKLYQKQKMEEVFRVSEHNMSTINESRAILASLSETYGNFDDIPQGDVLNKELNKGTSKDENRLDNNL